MFGIVDLFLDLLVLDWIWFCFWFVCLVWGLAGLGVPVCCLRCFYSLICCDFRIWVG